MSTEDYERMRDEAAMYRWLSENLASVQRGLDDRLRVVTTNDFGPCFGPWCDTYEDAVKKAMEQTK